MVLFATLNLMDIIPDLPLPVSGDTYHKKQHSVSALMTLELNILPKLMLIISLPPYNKTTPFLLIGKEKTI